MLPHRRHPDRLQILDRGAESDGVADRRRSRFEPSWDISQVERSIDTLRIIPPPPMNGAGLEQASLP